MKSWKLDVGPTATRGKRGPRAGKEGTDQRATCNPLALAAATSKSVHSRRGRDERMGETCDTQSKLLNSLHATIRIYVASTLDLHHKWHAATSFNSEKHMGRVHVKKKDQS